MPPARLKGVEDVYENCCGGSFYEWIFPSVEGTISPLQSGQICSTPVWFNDDKALTLVEVDYYSLDERRSTWRLGEFSEGTRDERLRHRPYKTFQLESDDDLLVVKCKIRPTIAIQKVSCDWRFPGNRALLHHTWLCLPIFSYKNRHTQDYVLQDQSLDRPHHFYYPPGTPGLDNESVAKLIELQFVPEANLTPMRKMCEIKQPHMARPFKLVEDAFNAVLGHLSQILPRIEISGEIQEWYELFVAEVREQIDVALRKKKP